jgi:hypothetical protein
MSRSLTEDAHAFALHQAARALLVEVAQVLGRAGVVVMPLKGVFLQQTVYQPPWARPMHDVDLLVPLLCFDTALHALAAAGFACERTSADAATVTSPDFGIAVDLHRRVMPPSWFDLPTRALFARATPDTALFGVLVMRPFALDVYAHLVAHFVTSRGRADDPGHLDDFAALARVFQFDARSCAAHLVRCSLTRAARYALGMSHAVRGDAFAAEVLRALPADPLGDAIATLALWARPWLADEGALGALPAHLLEPSLWRAVRSVLGRRGMAAPGQRPT